MKTFLLSFDPLSNSIKATQLLTFIQESRKVSQYYAPFVGAYVIKSEASIHDLQEAFAGIFDQTLFMIVEMEQGAVGGRLPINMWPFVNGQVIPALGWLQNQ